MCGDPFKFPANSPERQAAIDCHMQRQQKRQMKKNLKAASRPNPGTTRPTGTDASNPFKAVGQTFGDEAWRTS